MRKQIPLLLCLALVSAVALSGCLTNQSPTSTASYKNDVVTVEDYYVSNIKPYAGSETTMQFLLQNNGEHPVGRAAVNFFDTSGLAVSDFKCSDSAVPVGAQPLCTFGNSEALGEIVPFDVRYVSLRLTAPSADVIKKQTDFTVSYRIEYDYSGYRKADLPVVDGTTVRTASSRYSQSTASYGPVLLSFELPARGTHKEDGQTVTDYWGVRGEPFEVVMKLTDVASSKSKSKNLVLAKGSIMLDTKKSLQVADGMPCDFDVDASTGYLYSSKDVKVPGELRCSFKSYDFAEPETFATLWAEYSYTYGYTLTEKFQVQPIGET
jgi:hypothetical protein